MWAFGIDKNGSKEIQKKALIDRKPSDGLKVLEVEKLIPQPDEVIIKVKSSALNYNSIWSSLSHPVTPFQLINRHVQRNPADKDHLQDYAIFGSDAAGIISKVGSNVKGWKEGDEVIIHCNKISLEEPIIQKDGMLAESQSIWGYETNYGAFAEYCKAHTSQLIKKPSNIAWEVAGSFSLTLSTAYRMIISENGMNLKPNQNCLIWGAAGGLGSFAIQLVKLCGANAISIVSSDSKMEICNNLGSDVTINRKQVGFGDFILKNGEPNYLSWRKAKTILKNHGVNKIHTVFDHVGRETLGVSLSLLERGGSIVTCAASSGFNATIDMRYLWMSLKKIIGSHFANYNEATEASKLVFDGKIKPLIHSVNKISKLPKMIDTMHNNDSHGKIVFLHD